MSQEKLPNGKEKQAQAAGAAQSFLIGAFFSGLPIFVYLTLSLEMTYTPLTEISKITLVVAIAIPILCGLASAIYRDRATKLITTALESVNLPF